MRLSGDNQVQVLDVHKSFGDVHALNGVTLKLQRGTVTCVLGPSGSGKSTLLRCVNRLEVPDSGYVIVDDEVMGYSRSGADLIELSDRAAAKQRAHIGMVFQHFNLFTHKTVLENVIEGPLVVQKIARESAEHDAIQLLDRVGLSDKTHAYPSALSGGQQQRVAIARSLAMKPRLMLFDEPTSALDPELVGEVLAVMRDLARDGMTMIVVTHELAFASQVADMAVYMEEGQIVETGTPQKLFSSPDQERTRQFISHVL